VTRRDGGQAAVELALVLPVVVVALLVVVQIALVSRDQIVVIHAAREGARAAAVAPPAQRAALAGIAAGRATRGLDTGRVSVATTSGSGRVRVTVRYGPVTRVPLVGALLGGRSVSATATMAIEP